MRFQYQLSAVILATACCVAWLRCDRAFDLFDPLKGYEKSIAIEAGYIVHLKKCVWKDDKKAAYTVSFDDTRSSHFQTSAPELERRGMVGTFSLNTSYVVDWNDWRRLALAGHELASHTHTHVRCTEITEDQLHRELQRAKQEIMLHIPEIERVPSFTYPFGLYNEATHAVVREYHISARTGWGINNYDLSDDELLELKGRGVYPPYDMSYFNEQVDYAVRNRGWVLIYFHSISAEGLMDQATIPLDKYLQHIDYVKSMEDSLWIATQGDVADYIRLRRDAVVSSRVADPYTIELSLEAIPEDLAPNLALTINIVLPQSWQGHDIMVYDSQSGKAEIISSVENPVLIDVPQRTKLRLHAVDK
ncbi:polysaccharide deacetylase family protein [candidate division KSB1 bacterium]|nr:polysaccharide deacetylase family protein [candidate division KSB1 bacterium]